ncbi:hypothetical protein ABD86_07960 [Paenibacillus alvei]|nr:hypothetical protein [Paenibacillus alvei]MBG9743902.1 hypothetical protein [Paenibacillus alvei]
MDLTSFIHLQHHVKLENFAYFSKLPHIIKERQHAKRHDYVIFVITVPTALANILGTCRVNRE